MSFDNLVMSYHYECERRERRELMEQIFHGDYGTYICKSLEEKNKWRYLTSMGICFVLDYAETTIITAFPCSVARAREICQDAGVHMSNSLRKRIEKNIVKIDKFYDRKVA